MPASDADRLAPFPPTSAGLAEATATLHAWLEAHTVDPRTRFNVALVFDEIVGNIVRHAHARSPVRVTLAFESAVTMTIVDDGIRFDPCVPTEAPRTTSLDDARVGGLGLPLVHRLANRMTYERTPDGCNRLTLTVGEADPDGIA